MKLKWEIKENIIRNEGISHKTHSAIISTKDGFFVAKLEPTIFFSSKEVNEYYLEIEFNDGYIDEIEIFGKNIEDIIKKANKILIKEIKKEIKHLHKSMDRYVKIAQVLDEK